MKYIQWFIVVMIVYCGSGLDDVECKMSPDLNDFHEYAISLFDPLFAATSQQGNGYLRNVRYHYGLHAEITIQLDFKQSFETARN